MKRFTIFLLLVIKVFLTYSQSSNAVLTNDSYGLDLRKYVTVRTNYTHNDLEPLISLKEFFDNGHIDKISDTLTLYIPLKNASDVSSWVIGLGDSQSEVSFELFSEGILVQNGKAGLSRPISSREVPITKGEYIQLSMLPGNTYLLKLNYVLNDPFSKQLWKYSLESLKIYKQQQLLYEYNQERIWDSLFYGAVIIMLLYNGFLALTLKSKDYGWYTAFIFMFLLYNLGADGLLQSIVFFNYPILERKLRFLVSSAMVLSYIQFAIHFLKAKYYVPVLHKVLLYSGLLFIVGLLPILASEWHIARFILLISVVFTGILILYISIKIVRKNYVSAYYFLMANTILIAGGISTVLYMLSVIPHNVTTKFVEHAPQYASIFELTLFSLGLAARIKDTQREMLNQRVQLELEKKEIIQQKNQELEHKVEERTYKLIEQKKQIQNVNTQLEEKVRERTKKLQKAYRDLLNLNYELDSFIYRAAHDIRGPISTIMGLCNIALMEKDFAKCHEYLTILDKYSKTTQVTLNRILSVNDIKNNHIKLSKFSWHELEQEVLALLISNPDRDKVQIHFVGDLDGEIYSDKYLMQLLLVNLIDNSIRFRKVDGNTSAECTVEVAMLASGYHILVKDNGEGIEEGIKDKIFDMFFRGSEYASGSGLGLYICKLATRKLNGTIDLVSSRRGETIFELILPYFKEKTSYNLAQDAQKTTPN